MCHLYQSPITSQFLDFIHLLVFDLILYCVTVQAKNTMTEKIITRYMYNLEETCKSNRELLAVFHSCMKKMRILGLAKLKHCCEALFPVMFQVS